MNLEHWTTVKKQLGPSPKLLLGNGSSISVDKRLSYKSLYDKVRTSDRLPKDLLKVFEYFGTSNFEFIMRLLLETSEVNKALDLDDEKPRAYCYSLRDALIEAVRDIHPSYADVEALLPRIGTFLQGFRTVVSWNYDLLVYWAMLLRNTQLKCQWFKDCFLGGKFQRDFNYLYAPQRPATSATLVFYPHGSLFLATNVMGEETKLCSAEEGHLLETVLDKWKNADHIPLFVSEGTTAQKLSAIARSAYLSAVYDLVIRKLLSGALVIYGWSFGEQDKHILDAIDHESIHVLAVSVHTQNSKWEEYCEMVHSKIAQTRKLKNARLLFFDSASQGCWTH